jgi:hypothetical protein
VSAFAARCPLTTRKGVQARWFTLR